MEIFGAGRLADMKNIGTSKVDPKDIRPPRMLLVQKSSTIDEMVDSEGKKPEPGQFFHTGTKKIMNTFECYVLFAAKGTWEDRNKEPYEVKNAYNALMALKEDLSLFGMSFRSTSIYTLSGLFTAKESQKVPMFAFNVTFESKQLEFKGKQWFTPVIRIGNIESDPIVFDELYKMASGFDKNAESVSENIKEEEEGVKKDE